MVRVKSRELELEVIRATDDFRADPSPPSACSPSATASALLKEKGRTARREDTEGKRQAIASTREIRVRVSLLLPVSCQRLPGRYISLSRSGKIRREDKEDDVTKQNGGYKEKGENPQKRRPSKSAATDERVTAPASAGQRTRLLAGRGWKSVLKVLTSLKEPLLPEPAWDSNPQVSMNVLRRSNRQRTFPPCLA